jgi:hypothetical protein
MTKKTTSSYNIQYLYLAYIIRNIFFVSVEPLDSREFKLILKPKIFQVQIDKKIEMLNDKFIHDSDLKRGQGIK